MNTKRFTSLVLLTAAVAFVTNPIPAAETPAQKEPAAAITPTAEQVLARHLKACGGQAVLDKTTTLSTKGVFEGLEGTGLGSPANFEMLLKAPDKCLLTISDPNGQFFREGLNGASGWRGGRYNLSEMAPDHIAFAQGLVRVYLPNKLTEAFPKPALKPRETLQDREADVLEATTPQGDPFKLYFEVKTGYLIRVSTEFRGQVMRYDWDDYREVDGIKVPFKLSALEGSQTYTTRFTEVRCNSPIDDAKFNKPSQ